MYYRVGPLVDTSLGSFSYVLAMAAINDGTPASTPSSAGVPNLPLSIHLEKYLLGIKKERYPLG